MCGGGGARRGVWEGEVEGGVGGLGGGGGPVNEGPGMRNLVASDPLGIHLGKY